MKDLIIARGGNAGKHRCQVRKKLNRMVAEIHNPPGSVLDLTTMDEEGKPWDFEIPSHRRKAEQLIRHLKPRLLVGSLMCSAFCAEQNVSDRKSTEEAKRKTQTRARAHLQFTMNLYKMQTEGGRYFLHEHPAYVSSWDEDSTRRIMGMKGTETVFVHRTQFKRTGNPLKKPTKYISNAKRILEELERLYPSRPCNERRRYGRCGAAATCSLEICKAILRGLQAQMEEDGSKEIGEVGSTGRWDQGCGQRELMSMMTDDVSGQTLRPELVREAREHELQFFRDKRVIEKVPKGTARQTTERDPIPVRWVDTNKGDDERPQCRKRLVAQQVRFKGSEAVFAAMLPVEAVRMIASLLATALPGEDFKKHGPQRIQVSVVDNKRAYFNAVVPDDEPQYVQLPPEDPEHERCEGKVLKFMYGLQKAAEGWEKHYTNVLEKMGFRRRRAGPCVFVHPVQVFTSAC